jgi:hypothetical protein
VTRPGHLAGRFLAYTSTARTRERVFDEIVADMHYEWDAARAQGRTLRAAWIRARGHVHLLKVSILLSTLCAARNVALALHRYFAPAGVAAALTFALFLVLASLTTGADAPRLRPSTDESPPFAFDSAPEWRRVHDAMTPALASRGGSIAAP